MRPLRLLFVVQRYGREVRGGAEHAARQLAERMAARDHHVEVLTTTAQSYVDWSGDLPEGTTRLGGVDVHRLVVQPRRDPAVFDRLHHRLSRAHVPPSPILQRSWVGAQGPSVPELTPWLDAHAGRFDVAIFFTYLYATTTEGLPVAARHTATVLVPCAHDEPPLALPVFDRSAHLADALLLLTPEEEALVHHRFRLRTPHHVVGLGTELGVPDRFDAETPVTGRLGILREPYVLYVGRIDPSKGTDWLVDRFAALKAARPSPVKLVLLGEPVVPPMEHEDIVLITDADDDTRDRALTGAIALVQPSPYESFGLVVIEAWARGTPVIALGANEVLRGHLERSGGGVVVDDGAQLGAAIELLAADPDARAALGRAGYAHAHEHYAWPQVCDRWERALHRTLATGRLPAPTTPAPATSLLPEAPDLDAIPGPEPADGSGPTASVRRRDDQRPPGWLVRPLAAVLGLVAAAGGVGVVTAMLGVFEPVVVAAGSLVIGVPLALAAATALPRWSSPRSVHLSAAVVLLFVLASTLYNVVHHGEHVAADRDPGVYITTAHHLVEDGDLRIPGPTGPFADAPGISPNGVGFSPVRGDGTLEPQFPHLTAVALALGGWLTGLGFFTATPVIAGLALLCLYAWGSTVVGPRWAMFATVIAGTTMPFIVFARDAYSEPIAMLLLFGGLWVLHLGHQGGRALVWLLAGLLLGASSMARVDGYLYLAPVLLGLALTVRLSGADRRRIRIGAGLTVVGMAVTSAIGWWDTRTFTGGYYDNALRSRLPAMLGAAAVATVVGLLVAPLCWKATVARSDEDPAPLRPTPWLQAALLLGVVALAGFFAWAYWVRPDDEGLPGVSVEGLDLLSFLDRAATLSLQWLGWYLGPLGLAAGLAGLLWSLHRLGRTSFPGPAVIAGLGGVLTSLLLYLWSPSVTPDHPWAMRRFAAASLPGLAVGVAAAGVALWRLGTPVPRTGSTSRRRPTARAVAGSTAAIAVVVGTAASAFSISWPVRGARAQEGMEQRIAEICDAVGDDAAILVPIDGILALMMSVPVGEWCDAPSAGGTPALEPIDVARLAVEWDQAGRDLIVLSSSATPLFNRLRPAGLVGEPQVLAPVYPEAIEPTVTARPRRVVVDGRLGKGPEGEITFYVYDVDLEAARQMLADQVGQTTSGTTSETDAGGAAGT